jgi:hypothetical protein
MQHGRNEPRRMTHRSLGCARQQINESLLIRGIDGKDIDERHGLGAR